MITIGSYDRQQGKGVFRWMDIMLVTISIIFYGIIVIKSAWVAEDAYITFRTVDNFINGLGLTWNPGERVQSYTNPLWMLSMSLLYFFTNEIYLTSILFSLAISMVTLGILGFGISKNSIVAVVGIMLLTFSRAFIDYSTSGLENSMTHFMIVLFCWYYYKHTYFETKNILFLAMIAAFGMVNRMDTILLFLPAIIASLLIFRSSNTSFVKGLHGLCFGLVPFVLWEIFSMLYYGFPFPNTAYAKLGTGISTMDYFQQGLHYVIDAIERDPLIGCSIFITIIIGVLSREQKNHGIHIGILLYILYVIRIGGDFMSGRFLTAPFLLAVVSTMYQGSQWKKLILVIGCVLLVMGAWNPINPVIGQNRTSEKEIGDHGITDERMYYFKESALLQGERYLKEPRGELVDAGKEARKTESKVIVKTNIGYFGYYAGPKVHIIDPLALVDPFLSRLPMTYKKDWRIGHFKRTIPEGYVETIEQGRFYRDNLIRDRRLGDYYEKLSYITRGRILDPQRLKMIWNMNMGKYDYLIEREYR